MGFFATRRPLPSRRNVPPEFEWVQVQMDVTRWAITGVLGIIALGVWSGAMRLNDLGYSMEAAQAADIKHEQTNARQDEDIKKLETSITEHGVYLKQILEEVRKK